MTTTAAATRRPRTGGITAADDTAAAYERLAHETGDLIAERATLDLERSLLWRPESELAGAEQRLAAEARTRWRSSRTRHRMNRIPHRLPQIIARTIAAEHDIAPEQASVLALRMRERAANMDAQRPRRHRPAADPVHTWEQLFRAVMPDAPPRITGFCAAYLMDTLTGVDTQLGQRAKKALRARLAHRST